MIQTYFISLLVAILSLLLTDSGTRTANTTPSEEAITFSAASSPEECLLFTNEAAAMKHVALVRLARHKARTFGGSSHGLTVGKTLLTKQLPSTSHSVKKVTVPQRQVAPYIFWRNLRI